MEFKFFPPKDLAYQTPELIEFRKALAQDMVRKVGELNRENFAVKLHMKYVEKFSLPESYQVLSYEDTLIMGEEIAPLITPDDDHPKAMRFDALMYGIELAYLIGKKYKRAKTDLMKRVQALSSLGTIPEVAAQTEMIDKVLHTGYLEDAGINEFEHVREKLRDLMKYVDNVKHPPYGGCKGSVF